MSYQASRGSWADWLRDQLHPGTQWACPKPRFTAKAIADAIPAACHPAMVHQGVVEGVPSQTWYVGTMKMWIRLTVDSRQLTGDFHLQYITEDFVAALNAQSAASHPHPH